ncbi:BNR repeat-containing protein [Cohnella fermenti]|uniref:Uncharacterized protein n=1 Tax=Cohnella fermenti TaxID=2565925 RepID=A0A4S4C9E3_9BACL|nr:BNR repeat-containing protein [Cohnella fermenti]THF84679.1 hypothetical protein E6C55_01535 [Cohnella fermenti]
MTYRPRWKKLGAAAIVATLLAGASLGGFPAGAVPAVTVAGGVVIDSQVHVLNTAPFDQDKVITYQGYQYTIYWDSDYKLVLSRRKLSDNSVQSIVFANTVDNPTDGHYNTTIGISPGDGRLHLSYGHHNTTHHYRVSSAAWLTSPPATISTSQFGAETHQTTSATEDSITYPRYFNDKNGKLYFSYRYGGSGDGEDYLNKYDSSTGTWTSVGKLFSKSGTYVGALGTTVSRNAYVDDFIFDDDNRLHMTWTWRESYVSHAWNHDIHYAYSDDYGVTWYNNAGTKVADLAAGDPIAIGDPGLVVVSVPQNSWLINQGTMVVDADGQPHLFTQRSTATNAALSSANVHQIHYWRNASGTWGQAWITDTTQAHGSTWPRGQVVMSEAGNAYFFYSKNNQLVVSEAKAANQWATSDTGSLLNGVVPSGEGWVFDRWRFASDGVVSLPSVEKSGTLYQYAIRDFTLPSS